MHQNPAYQNHVLVPTAQALDVTSKHGRSIREWLRAATLRWRRRKMIATFEAMDDRLLWDIGIHRTDIVRMVDNFDERELRMRPLALPAPTDQSRDEPYGEMFQKAA
ncbi:DUF1127 domain-containing protein [Roseovarius sp. Pro17]|uniref:DUF1127 domain-containing protein n=1 Tax=Roseovarius sp. Pro17 TaxID=3108175 RepID=UPI002D76AB2C|nr:DUF1127 domain-containing protein [Roseovarius sp. Pro17]